MNVVIIGSGGREHALALKIKQSKKLKNLYTIPGNPGTDLISQNINLNPSDKEKILEFCSTNKIDLVIIGPEQPLVDGLTDFLKKNKIIVFGPSETAARIESSKSYAKDIMARAGVPTAVFKEFRRAEFDEARKYLSALSHPIVIKADGLAAGKGVLICNNEKESENALNEIFVENAFGSSGEKILVEEFLTGEEASVFAITDGTNFISLPAAQDHKRIGDNDTGKNTGGMGAYAPAPLVNEKLAQEIDRKIIAPVIQQMKKENNPFVGCLYAGLMITKSGPKVIEFNCRFGDPETQVVLPILDGDFLQLLYSAASGNLDKHAIKYSGGSSVCVVAASSGYPESYKKGFEISGLTDQEEIIIYHAGTKKQNDKILTNGGRVLGITSVLKKNDLKIAKKIAYDAISKISFEGIYYRKDIAEKAFKYL